MFEIKVIKTPIQLSKIQESAKQGFGYLTKAVVDIEQEIMAIGGEFHADEETILIDNHNSSRVNTWGINFRFDKPEKEMIEFDSLINIKPNQNNISMGIDSKELRDKIIQVVNKLTVK